MDIKDFGIGLIYSTSFFYCLHKIAEYQLVNQIMELRESQAFLAHENRMMKDHLEKGYIDADD
jgi:hypothetical protein